MLKYHHLGIPTDVPREGETYLAELRCMFPDMTPAHTRLSGCALSPIVHCRNW